MNIDSIDQMKKENNTIISNYINKEKIKSQDNNILNNNKD